MTTVWFWAIAVLWIGYLFLEGFDFGVGMLLGWQPTEQRKRVLINTIGPVWDGNEVWMIVAVGAMFAAFPDWYATLLPSCYIPMLVILLALIGRGVAFEYRGMVDSSGWRRCWDVAIALGSWLPPACWGLVLAANFSGLPVTAEGQPVGGLSDLFTPVGLLGAAALTGFSLTHGAVFLAVKTTGETRRWAIRLVEVLVPLGLLPLVGFAWWAWVPAGLVATVLTMLATTAVWRRRPGLAFGLSGALIAVTVVGLFAAVHPVVLVSSLDPAWSLTADAAASSPYTLTVVTWVAAFGLPGVVVYQAWTYWVFRRRIGTGHLPAPFAPVGDR